MPDQPVVGCRNKLTSARRATRCSCNSRMDRAAYTPARLSPTDATRLSAISETSIPHLRVQGGRHRSALMAPRLLSIRAHRSRPALGRDILPSPTTGGFGLPTRHSHTDADDGSISYVRKQMLNELLDELDHCNSLVSAVPRD